MTRNAFLEESMKSKADHKDSELLSWRSLFLTKAKLKASSRTSGLMSGFAMVAMVEINLDVGANQIPPWLAILFSFMTTILISVHVFALMISVCILPNIETVEQMHNSIYVQQEIGEKIMSTDSPHRKFRRYIEVAWIFSTGLGTLLFLMEIPVLMFVKFYHLSLPAAYISLGIMVPVCVLFVIFALRFYRKLVEHKHHKNAMVIEELQEMATQLGHAEESAMIHHGPKLGKS